MSFVREVQEDFESVVENTGMLEELGLRRGRQRGRAKK